MIKWADTIGIIILWSMGFILIWKGINIFAAWGLLIMFMAAIAAIKD